MHHYRFTGHVETVLTGLSHGVNAILHRDGHEQPDGSTVVAQPGDEVTTDEPYVHAHMVNTDTGEPDHHPDTPPKQLPDNPVDSDPGNPAGDPKHDDDDDDDDPAADDDKELSQ